MQWKLISNDTTDCIAAAAGAQAESILYQFGGQLGDLSYSNKLLLSTNNGQTWHEMVSSSSESPSARVWSTLSYDSVHHLLYIFGGLGLNEEIYNDLWVYNLTSLQFTRLIASNCSRVESQPSCRSGHGSIVMDGVLYILGGEAINGDGLDDVWHYKFVWARESAPWKKRLGTCVFSWKNKMFLFAGINGWKDMQMYNDMWVREDQ